MLTLYYGYIRNAGHLAGILVGLVYLQTPLKALFERGELPSLSSSRPRFTGGGVPLGGSTAAFSGHFGYTPRSNEPSAPAPDGSDDEQAQVREALRRSYTDR